MIKVAFFGTDPCFGFHVKGHSDSAIGDDIICAAVSSAAYMTANTITDVLHCSPDLKVSNGDMYLKLGTEEAYKCSDILSGFYMHIVQLQKQYEKYISVTISEV